MKLQRKNRLRALSVSALAVTSALVLSACGSDDNTGGDGSEGGQKDAGAADIKCDGDGNLIASGSSAQKNAVDAWVQAYQQACSGTKINYKATGSGAGIQEFLQGKTAFAGSDSVLKEDEVEQSAKVCKSGKAVNLPLLAGPVAIGYNLSGVDDLVLDASTLAKIFDSKITKWDDAAIKKLNPDADLPSTKIQAFHRSDESGTTDNFTSYLAAAASGDWKHEPGKAWAAKGGQSADGSAGVASNVKQTEGAIGYFELSYATGNNIPAVQLDTGAGDPVEATVENSSAAVSAGKIVGKDGDLAMELDYATKEEGAYPIILVTYEIACDKGNKAETLPATKSFLKYAASEDGQKVLADIDYAPMPEEIITQVRKAVDSLA